MSDVFEVVFTSSDGDKTNTINVWNVQTGTNLMTYKDGGTCALKGLSLLSSEYVIAAEKNKPLLKVWAVNCQLPLNSPRLLCQGIVTTSAVSPDNCYIAVAVQEKLHIYSVSSGNLLGTGARHFQPIRVLKWSLDGNFIACGGDDGLTTVWMLCNLISLESEPLYTFSDHTLPVSDIYITPGGMKAYIITVSSDRTCKIYYFRDGSLLLSLVFDTILTAVCTNSLQSHVFIGTTNGGILQFNLHNPPRTREYHLNTEEKVPLFVGHSKSITCLSNSLDGELLLSGSADETAKIWHIYSKQCLRTIAHKGQVTNAFFTIAPKQMFNNELKLSVRLSDFRKADDESEFINIFTNFDLNLDREADNLYRETFNCENGLDTKNNDHINSLKHEIERLKSVNKGLYDFAVRKILENDKHNGHCEDDSDNFVVETNKCSEQDVDNVEGKLIKKSGKKINKTQNKKNKNSISEFTKIRKGVENVSFKIKQSKSKKK